MAGKIIIVLGPTAVGKTAYAISLARALGSPVINCDSRQLYREMNIGVARPSEAQLDEVRHYFVATHSIHHPYSAGQYEIDAWQLVHTLLPQHPTLVMAGGSGLYIDAFCNGMDDFPPPDEAMRTRLWETALAPGGMETMRKQLKMLDPQTYATIDLSNRQRVVRAVEVSLLGGRPYSSYRRQQPRDRGVTIEKRGLEAPREWLYERIDSRVDVMMEQGLLEEARALYPYRQLVALQTVGYRELFDYFDGTISLDRAVELIKRNSRHYAKRQMTYWRRDATITWEHVVY